jgi:hypothetical protein
MQWSRGLLRGYNTSEMIAFRASPVFATAIYRRAKEAAVRCPSFIAALPARRWGCSERLRGEQGRPAAWVAVFPSRAPNRGGGVGNLNKRGDLTARAYSTATAQEGVLALDLTSRWFGGQLKNVTWPAL